MSTRPVSTGPASPVYIINTGWRTVRTSGQVSVATISTQLLPDNPLRVFLSIANNTLVQAYLQLDSAAQISKGIRLNAGGVFTMSGFETFLGPINAISTNGSIMLDVLEGEP